MMIANMPRQDDSPPNPAAAASAGAAGAGAPLDAAALRRLHELDPDGANRVVERVMRAYEASLERLLAQAEAAQPEGDEAILRHVAHTLKSSSASVGALELSRYCGEIENRLRSGRDDGLGVLLQAMQAEGQRVLVMVRGLLAGCLGSGP